MKKTLSFFFIVVHFFLGHLESWASRKKVFISQTIEHPALNETVKGVKDALKKGGYEQGKNLELRNESAQANAALAGQIAHKFMSQNPDIIVGVGTLSAQSFIKYTSKGQVKLIFSSVTDPVGAHLIPPLPHSSSYVSGVSNFVDLKPQLTLFKKLQPQLKRIGILYNPGEMNSLSIIHELEELCPQLGLVLVKQGALKTIDVPQGATKLAQVVDAIFISNDNTALSGLQSIFKAARLAAIPVYVSDTDAVASGALAAFGPNQYEVGLQTGDMIVRLLNGDDMVNQKMEFPHQTAFFINLDVAHELGIVIPKELKDAAITKLIQRKNP